MNLELEDRNCIVIGGSRGIGRAISLGLAAEGANVAICARNEEPLRETEAAILEKGVRAHAEVCDVLNAILHFHPKGLTRDECVAAYRYAARRGLRALRATSCGRKLP